MPCTVALGQALPAGDAGASGASTASANKIGPAGIIPVHSGYNVSVVSGSQYDSGGGWSSILTPDVAFRFNRHLSVDFATPTFVYFMASINTGTAASPVYTVEPRHFAMGDSTLAGHAEFNGDPVSYSLTAAIGMPTGNATYGLTAGQSTYNLNNHFDLSVGRLSPDIELGLSDTSLLINQRLSRARTFSSTGKLAHFQAGSSIDLPWHCSFEADAYEDLPIGAQQVTGSTKGSSGVVGRGAHGKPVNLPGKGAPVGTGSQGGQTATATTTVTSSGLAEDNGLYTSLDMPLNPHLVLSGVYGYSVRQQDATAGFSLTYLLRARPAAVR